MSSVPMRAQRIFHILVVDDDPAMRLMVRAMLERDRRLHVVAEAYNGRDAVSLVERTCPDAVVLGMQMPLVDGITATSLIKRVCPNTAVIIFSAVTTTTLVQKAFEAGADLYLSKTTRPADLAEAINKLCVQAARLSEIA
ncbi:MAG TPA: response regulator transcription factor [Actinomycetota bacterium]|nr:response regulator transcription factor [Actinomycetota bacterium]